MLWLKFKKVLLITAIFILIAIQNVWAAYLVCLDPGHGGNDKGAIGPTGYFEKEANLEIGLKLRDLLITGGYNVLMTRETDTNVNLPPVDRNGDGKITQGDELQARCDIANQAQADIYVSLHNNANRDTTQSGTETYYFSQSYQGKLLAFCIQEELTKQINRLNRGIKAANFYVLTYTNMPSVLVESAFISNPEEEALLRDAHFKQKIAQGIFQGIERYFSLSLPRLYGLNRYETAVKISQEGWVSSDKVILTTGENFPDALGAAPLAFSQNMPILLTQSATLLPVVLAEIKRLSAKEVIIVGGEQAVSNNIKVQLEVNGLLTERIGGKDRYETASLIAKRVGSSDGTGIIVSGENYPDALSISSYASANRYPLFLVQRDNIPYKTMETLAFLGIKKTIIVGGEGVISKGIEDWLRQKNYNPVRISGKDRYETSYRIALSYYTFPSYVFIATGENFPDALCASSLAAKYNSSPILLVSTKNVYDGLLSYLLNNKGTIEKLSLLGGVDVISSQVEKSIASAFY